MAVTAIWDIRGRVDRVINYVNNSEKTTENGYESMASLHAIDDVLEYVGNDMKTERRMYVSGINCDPLRAAEQFKRTKRYWEARRGKRSVEANSEIVAFHGYQSFKPGEVDADTAHLIGEELAKELWGDRFEVVIATHLNKDHYHNHFVLNSVSFKDGKRYYDQKSTYGFMREVSDRLCREHRLSVITNPGGRAKNYGEWLAEKNGKPTIRGTIRADIDRAILASVTERDFIRVLTEMGYEIRTKTDTGSPLKYPKIKPPGAKGYFRFHSLGEGYDLDTVKWRIQENIRKHNPFPEVSEEEKKPYYHYKERAEKATGLQALYLYYCYELHIIAKHPASVKKVSVFLREDLIKLDKFIAQADFLSKTGIRTIDELTAYKTASTQQVTTLTETRKELRNKLKQEVRRESEDGAAKIKAQIMGISSELKTYRKEIRLCDDIAARSEQVRLNLKEIERQHENERKEETANELFIGRSSRTGRENDAQRR